MHASSRKLALAAAQFRPRRRVGKVADGGNRNKTVTFGLNEYKLVGD